MLPMQKQPDGGEVPLI